MNDLREQFTKETGIQYIIIWDGVNYNPLYVNWLEQQIPIREQKVRDSAREVIRLARLTSPKQVTGDSEWFRKSIAEEMTRKELEDRLVEQNGIINQLRNNVNSLLEADEPKQVTDAIEFAEYIGWLNGRYNKGWWVDNDSDINPHKFYTTAELYEQFKQIGGKHE